MSAEEFWKDDPQLFVSYRISFIKKKESELTEEDYKSWLRGLYIYDGNSKLFATLKQFINNTLAGMFKSSKDNTKIETYPSKPYFELKKEQEEKQAKEKQQELKRKEKYKNFENSLLYYGSMKQRYLDNLQKKGE
jgi:hypothetical protein